MSRRGDSALGTIRSYKELRVYQVAMEAAIRIFELTKRFPAEEKFLMVHQMRRSSRSVCSNVAEAWRKRRYPAHFISKLSDAEAEGEETGVWLRDPGDVWRVSRVLGTRTSPAASALQRGTFDATTLSGVRQFERFTNQGSGFAGGF